MITQTVGYLKDFIDNKRGIYEPATASKYGDKSILMLAYYRNTLTHLFINEAEIACAILGFSLDKTTEQAIPIDTLWKRV